MEHSYVYNTSGKPLGTSAGRADPVKKEGEKYVYYIRLTDAKELTTTGVVKWYSDTVEVSPISDTVEVSQKTERERIEVLLASGKNVTEIAAEIGVSRQKVSALLRKYGLTATGKEGEIE